MQRQRLKAVVGSLNPVKIGAVRAALSALHPAHEIECEGIDSPSGVDAQPLSAAVTRQGALNRVAYCQAHARADFYVAIEAGVEHDEDGASNFAYIVIASQQRRSVGRSASLPLPAAVHQALIAGEELGAVMDRLFGTHNIKQQGGAVALLTQGCASREETYRQALLLTMAPFLHPQRYACSTSS